MSTPLFNPSIEEMSITIFGNIVNKIPIRNMLVIII